MLPSVNVDSCVPASSDIHVGSEETPASVTASEEVDLRSMRAEMIGHTIELTSANYKYNALITSDITPPTSHNYETINYTELAEYVNANNTSPQNEPSDVRMECFPDYYNVLTY